MQLTIDPAITVTLDTTCDIIRFSSIDRDKLISLAKRFALGRGLTRVGACRVTDCNITPGSGNVEELFGVPSAHYMALVSHEDLLFAGAREPGTVTVYRTLKQTIAVYHEDGVSDGSSASVSHYVYHFNVATA